MGNLISQIKKRSGEMAPYDRSRIVVAAYKALDATSVADAENVAERVASGVEKRLQEHITATPGYVPGVEHIQGLVEAELTGMDQYQAAEAFMVYRVNRMRVRKQNAKVTSKMRELARTNDEIFGDNHLGQFVHMSKYARWIPNEGRRETWIETVGRYFDYMNKRLDGRLNEDEIGNLKRDVLHFKVMPSMRLLWSAGNAVESTNVAAYNCAYTAPRSTKDFAELMYVLMASAGAGFSVEQKFISQLPIVRPQTGVKIPTHLVEDSKEGWANAFKIGLDAWWEGRDLEFDYSKVRPAGAVLKTMGGRASGPEPLKRLLDFSRGTLLKNVGRRLTPLQVHDIVCKTGEVVVAGGVRRSALMSLSDLSDIEMRDSKQGTFFYAHPYRQMANNSAVYEQKPTATDFMSEFLALAQSGSGERGIFNRGGLIYQLPKRRIELLGLENLRDVGMNPCGEILVPLPGFCNLTEIVARAGDTLEMLLSKAKTAAILGTFQAMLTDFPFLSSGWKENCERERLLGVSMTGIMDNSLLMDEGVLRQIKDQVIETNREYAKRFGINSSTCATCVKPSGSVSCLVDSASGAHVRHAPYYIRRARVDEHDPLLQLLIDQKYPISGKNSDGTYSIPFAIRAPERSVFRKDLNARQQLENWRKLKQNFTEHNPSVTISVGDNEWLSTANWIFENWNDVGGLSFFPRDDNVYHNAPFEEITQEEYNRLKVELPKIDYAKLPLYEGNGDQTSGAKEVACHGGKCEI